MPTDPAPRRTVRHRLVRLAEALLRELAVLCGRLGLVVLLLGLAPLLLGCGGDTEAPVASDPPTTTAPSTTLSATARDEAALRQLTEDWFEARSDVLHDGADPSIAERYATGEHLETFVEDVEAFRASGRTVERRADTREVIESIEVDGDRATVATCFVDADALYDEDGELINDDIGSGHYELAATRADDGWVFVDRSKTASEDGDTCGR